MTSKEFKSQLLPIKSKLFRLAMTMLGSRHEAEDIVQDVFLKLWKMNDELGEYQSLEALAVTITKNLSIDRLRSYQSRYQNEDGLETMTIPANENDPAQALELKESVQRVHKIIQQLPEKQRLVMHLRQVEQYSYDEIEEITELTRNNIRVLLSRARKRVRKTYEKETE